MALTRAVVGGKVSAAITNGIIDQVEEIGRHAEFTATSASVASATASAVGTLVLDASKSNNTAFAIGGVSQVTLTDEGIYAIDVSGTIPVNPTGVYWLRIYDGANYYYISGVGTIIGGSVVASFWCPAATVMQISFLHTSAANRVLTSRFKITRLA